jgi:hypothetical protein
MCNIHYTINEMQRNCDFPIYKVVRLFLALLASFYAHSQNVPAACPAVFALQISSGTSDMDK